MDLWIRSQNKNTLIKVDSIEFVSPTTYDFCVAYNSLVLGTYKTKERALEILDDIQSLLIGDLLLFKNINVFKDIEKHIGFKCLCVQTYDNK